MKSINSDSLGRWFWWIWNHCRGHRTHRMKATKISSNITSSPSLTWVVDYRSPSPFLIDWWVNWGYIWSDLQLAVRQTCPCRWGQVQVSSRLVLSLSFDHNYNLIQPWWSSQSKLMRMQLFDLFQFDLDKGLKRYPTSKRRLIYQYLCSPYWDPQFHLLRKNFIVLTFYVILCKTYMIK